MSACCPPAGSQHTAQQPASADDSQIGGMNYEVRITSYEVINPKPGGHSLMVPPGPIPNPEVKHQHVDGSRTTGPARVDSCQGKRSPQSERIAGFIVCVLRTQISSMHSMDIVRHQPDIVQPQAGYRFQYSRDRAKSHPLGSTRQMPSHEPSIGTKVNYEFEL